MKSANIHFWMSYPLYEKSCQVPKDKIWLHFEQDDDQLIILLLSVLLKRY